MSRTTGFPVLAPLLASLALFALGCGDAADDAVSACTAESCSGHGVCKAEEGRLSCDCDQGYLGTRCETAGCAVGLLDCGAHGTCTDTDGSARCACSAGWAGDRCADCAAGFQDHDHDGTCLPDCDTAALACAHATCNDASGEAVCECLAGHTGEGCAECASGYQDNDGDGNCEMTCAKAYPACGHGHCDDSGGAPTCVCDPTWGGVKCDRCADGYQDHDGDGKCREDCATAGVACQHGQCDDASGVARCACDAGYGGAECGDCAAGYQDNDADGVCVAGCPIAGLSCHHGACVDHEGVARCACAQGYEGADCTSCAAGYQDNDQNGDCRPTCGQLGYTCSGVGTCSDAGGVAMCACPAGLYDDGAGGCITATGYWCKTAELLDIYGGSVSGTTTGAGNEHHGSCQAATGEDRIYHFTVTDPVRVRFHATGFDTVLYVRTTCDDGGSELACSDDDGPASSARIERDFAPGDYYLFVDGFASEGGDYQLDVAIVCGPGLVYDAASDTCVTDPCEPNPCTEANRQRCSAVLPASYECACDQGWVEDPPSSGTCEPDPAYDGEDCSHALGLVPGQGSVTGSTVNAQNDGKGTCGGDGPDRVYAFFLEERRRVTFTMTGYDTVLYLRTKCGHYGSQVACSDDGQGVAASLSKVLEPGYYYLFADSASAGGNYTLTYDFRPDPCAGDPCPGVPQCVPAQDWSSHACVCPSGSVAYGAACVDDPCDPNPCAGGAGHRTRCTPELATGQHACVCAVGYLEEAGACVPDPAAAEWSFLVFLNADNNLESDGYDDVAEMGVAGSTAQVRIAALFDSFSKDHGDARKVTVTQGGYVVEENLGEVDMGDWNTLAEYGVWALQQYPARHYALVLWNHGSGWRSASRRPIPVFKGFSNDDHGSAEGISISNGDYASALSAITGSLGDKLDLVGFDACLMGMWEVAEATSPYARTLVASEETEPAAGWPYDDFLVPLVANPAMTPLELGTSIVDSYYADDDGNSTLSVVDLDTMGELRVAMSAFADALRGSSALYPQIEGARKATQNFSYYDDDRDLKDFATRIAGLGGASPTLVAAAQALASQLGVTIVHSRAQHSHPRATGLSVYLPARGSGMEPEYRGAGAVWSVNTTWDEFVESFAN